MKKILLMTLFCLAVLVGCSQSEKKVEEQPKGEEKQAAQETEKQEENKDAEETKAEKVTVKVGVPKAPPALPVLRMMDSKALGENVTIEVDLWEAPEKLIAMVQGGEHDLFAFPLTVVAKLHNKGMDVKLMNVNTWGVTYFMTSDPDFKSWADLKGKTVYVPLQSSPPDALTQYFIKEAGLEVGKDVTIQYASMPEVAQLLISGEAQYATLIEPQVTRVKMGNQNVRVALAFEDEWKRATASETMIPNAGFGATGKFIAANPELAKKFNEEYEKALQWVNENPEEAGKLAEQHLGLKAPLIAKSLPNMGMHFKTPQDASEELKMFYELLHSFDPKMIGGKLPADTMYYEQ